MDQQQHVSKLDHSYFWGEWHNTNSGTTGINKVIFTDKEGKLAMRAYTNSAEGPVDLGEAEVRVFAERTDSTEGNKFAASYRFEFMEMKMHGWVKLGVLVISVFNRFTDNSGRPSFFNREFFYAPE